MDGKISEQRVYCKIRAQLGFPPTEIHADLQEVYGNGALRCTRPNSLQNHRLISGNIDVLGQTVG